VLVYVIYRADIPITIDINHASNLIDDTWQRRERCCLLFIPHSIAQFAWIACSCQVIYKLIVSLVYNISCCQYTRTSSSIVWSKSFVEQVALGPPLDVDVQGLVPNIFTHTHHCVSIKSPRFRCTMKALP